MAGRKIFTNQYDETESWTAMGALVEWTTQALEEDDENDDSGELHVRNFPLLMQRIQITYRRKVTDIPVINTDQGGKRKRYRVYDAPDGTLMIQSIFSPYVKDLAAFMDAVSKECKGPKDQVTMTFSPFGSLECNSNRPTTGTDEENPISSVSTFGKFMLKNVDLEQIVLDIQAGQGGSGATTTLPLNFSFSTLEWDLDNE